MSNTYEMLERDPVASPQAITVVESPKLPSRNATRRATTPDIAAQPSPVQRAATSFSSMFIPEKKVGDPPGPLKEIREIVFGSWFNVLLVCIPISWALHWATPNSHTLVFVFSFLAIIPLAKLLAFGTDELSIRVGETLAGLLNATLGNVVELIVAILALIKCELRVVQSSLVGSILSNLLLVLGMCFFAGGTRFSEQGFAVSATQLNSSLLTLSVIGVLIPAAFDAVTGNNQIAGFDTETEQRDILKVSHGVAIILLFIYASYLVFQLFSHKSLYDGNDEAKPRTIAYAPRQHSGLTQAIMHPRSRSKKTDVPVPAAGSSSSVTHVDPNTDVEHNVPSTENPEEDEVEVPKLSVAITISLLVIVTVLIGVTAEWLVGSIDGLTASGAISKEFVGLILLPIVGNAAEHVTAVMVSVKDKLTLSLGVAVGSSIQISLFVIPFIVILGWILGHPLTLLFDPFESIVLFLAVLTVNYVVQDGKSNWLEGMILMCLYIIIAVVFWFYPGTEPTGILATC